MSIVTLALYKLTHISGEVLATVKKVSITSILASLEAIISRYFRQSEVVELL